MSGEEREGFLARWSRRKREAAPEPDEAPAPEPPPAAEAAEPESELAPAASPACPIPNLPEIDLASLPKIEELTAESDFSLFLRPGVPSMLRHAALRRMWSLDPAIRDYIGPVEYQWDFNTPGGLPLGFADKLSGDVGKLLAQAIGRLEELAPDEAPEPQAVEDAPAAPPADPVASLEPPRPPEVEPKVSAAPEEPESQPAVPRRRHGGALPS